MVNSEQVLDALRGVKDPELHRDIVSLGMIEELKVDGGLVSFTFNLTTPACPLRTELEPRTLTVQVDQPPAFLKVTAAESAKTDLRVVLPYEAIPFEMTVAGGSFRYPFIF